MCFYFYWRTLEKILPVLFLFFFGGPFSHSFGVLNFKGEKSIRDNSFYSSLEY